MSISNLIIDFGTKYESLADRLDYKNESHAYFKVTPDNISSDLTGDELSIFNKVTETTRIYLMAHGEKEYAEDIYGYANPSTRDRKIFFNYTQISDFLSKHIEKQNINNKALKISLVICHAGLNEKHFAANLHRDLGKRHQLMTEVNARKDLTLLIQNANENTGKKVVRTFEELNVDARINYLNDCFADWFQVNHQKPGTKCSFTWSAAGEALMVDSYIAKLAQLIKEISKQILNLPEDEVKQSRPSSASLLQMNSICSHAEDLDSIKIHFIYNILKQLETSESVNQTGVLKNINKALGICLKYTDNKDEMQNLQLFKDHAILASQEMLNLLTAKSQLNFEEVKSKVHELKELIHTCREQNSLDTPAIKKIVTTLKNMKFFVYGEGSITSHNLIKAYEFARKSIYQWEPIKSQFLGYDNTPISVENAYSVIQPHLA